MGKIKGWDHDYADPMAGVTGWTNKKSGRIMTIAIEERGYKTFLISRSFRPLKLLYRGTYKKLAWAEAVDYMRAHPDG